MACRLLRAARTARTSALTQRCVHSLHSNTISSSSAAVRSSHRLLRRPPALPAAALAMPGVRSSSRRSGSGASASASRAAGDGGGAMAPTTHKHTNRLAQEQSPYLLQHAHNPVEWYPWGEEAFAAARAQHKPIFLSVGYATCHWCHVMEGESFESEETAAIMNRHFINIKVDREERPDVDRVYMTFVQASTGGGGWPMSVWLTPELKPFYGGTYLPGKDSYGMPSFTTVLKRIAQLWDTKRGELEAQAASVIEQLQEMTAPDSPDAAAAAAGGASDAMSPQQLAAAVRGCAASLAKGFDPKLGGFSRAPKFPRPSELNLLLCAAAAAEAQAPAASGAAAASGPSAGLLRGMALFTLQAMAAGGMRDQLGGGFHRYSVDKYWHVPHFELMLYDNPQLVLTYLDAFRVALAAAGGPAGGAAASGGQAAAARAAAGAGAGLLPSPAVGAGAAAGGSCGSTSGGDEAVLWDARVYADVARGVLDYLRRGMTHPEGGLYSAEDADSLDPATNSKREGAFYVWSADEVAAVLDQLPAQEGGSSGGRSSGSRKGTQQGQQQPSVATALFCKVYGVAPGGNCTRSARSDPHGEFQGKNVLAEFVKLEDAVASLAAAGVAQLSVEQARALLGRCRRALFEARGARPRPSLDDKVVTAWNGQGISALSLAARVLAAQRPPPAPCFPVEGAEPRTYLQAAVRVVQFVQRRLWDPSRRRLKRAFCKAPSAVEGFADDYALLIQGLLDLYEAGGGLEWLRWALQLQDTLDTLFWDPTGGYFQTSGTDASVLLRLKEDYDGAEPAASSVAAANLLRLAALLPTGASPSAASGSSGGGGGSSTPVMTFGQRADAVLGGFSSRLQQAPIAMPQMCVAAWLKSKTPLRQVIIAGSAADPATSVLLDAAHAAWAPDKALILVDLSDAAAVEFWRAHNPEAWAMVDAHFSKQGQQQEATAFVCQNFTCQAPTSSAAKLYELLAAQQQGGGGAPKLQPVTL